MFYKVDSTRMALREYAWSTPMPLWPVVLPIVAVLKLLRIRLPVPAVVPDSLEPYRVEPTDIPEQVRAKLQPLEDQMRDPAGHCRDLPGDGDPRHPLEAPAAGCGCAVRP